MIIAVVSLFHNLPFDFIVNTCYNINPETKKYEADWAVAGALCPRGKSELHRAGCWVTPSEGNLKESATEKNRLVRGKGATVR